MFRFAHFHTGMETSKEYNLRLKSCLLLRKKHPVVPEQYARVVGFGEPMDTGAL